VNPSLDYSQYYKPPGYLNTQTTRNGHMTRQKASVKKQPVVPESPNKSKKKTQGPESSTLEQVKQISQEGKDTHLQSNQTKKAYAGHVRRGRDVSQSVDLGRSNNPNTTPTKGYKKVRVVVCLRSVQRGCAEEGERGSTPTG